MKILVKLPAEVEITHVRVGFPVEAADLDADTPFLRGGRWWTATIEIASGQIMGGHANRTRRRNHRGQDRLCAWRSKDAKDSA